MTSRITRLSMALVLLLSMALVAGCPPPVEVEPVVPTYEADVVIIGAGGAGLAAAVSAAERGATVILLEKMPAVGGNTIIAGGFMAAVFPERQEPLGIEDSIELHIEQVLEGGDWLGCPVLVRTMVEGAEPALRWMMDMGLELDPYIHFIIGSMWRRAHRPVEPAGVGFIRVLKNAALEKGVNLRLNTKAESLIVEDGRVVGVMAKGRGGEEIRFMAHKGVVLASGGFAEDIPLRMMFVPELDPLIFTTNHPGATGEGILMALDVGAQVIGMEWIQGLPVGRPGVKGFAWGVTVETPPIVNINLEGRRFIDENERRDRIMSALVKQPERKMFMVGDAKSMPPDRVNVFGGRIDKMIADGLVFEADTLEELAKLIGVPVDAFVAQMERYNADIAAGIDDEFGKIGRKPIVTPPFHAAGPTVPILHHTMGGVKIDVYTRVIDVHGRPIPGLYAAGEVTGGIHGTNRLGSNALTDIFVFGRIAGESAAGGR